MDKPQPKTELAVRTVASIRDYRSISLSYTTREAEEWITTVAPRYGVLIACKGQRYTLQVDTALWDVHAVAAYLLSYAIDENSTNVFRAFIEGLDG